jgi:hypothetical protein
MYLTKAGAGESGTVLKIPRLLLKKTVYTRIDTSENAPANQGELIRIWDRSWRLRGWKTKILLPGEGPVSELCVSFRTLNFSYRKPEGFGPVAIHFGEPLWMEAPLVIFPKDVTEQQILECGRSIC